jgi:hypothetical protein
MPAMKRHKLAYYAQARSLVWDERALFADPIRPALYALHHGHGYEIAQVSGGDANRIDALAAGDDCCRGGHVRR